MQNKPLVSVIMNCLNCEKYLKEAIESVYAQTYDNWEIIFWDNCSTDRSPQIANSFAEQLKYFSWGTTLPLGRARNLAMKKADGEFIAFLDCDDLWLPTKLETQIPLFKEKDIGLVYSDVLVFDEEGKSYKWSERFRPYSGSCFAKLFSDYFLNMQSVVLRKKALDKEDHWFDDNLEYMEERDLFTRIAYNWKLAKCEKVLAKYRLHSSSMTSTRVDELGFKELEYILAKYQNIYPGLGEKYPLEIENIRKEISYNKAYWLWQKNKGDEARKVLKGFIFKNIVCTLIYFLTFLPFINLKKIRRTFQ